MIVNYPTFKFRNKFTPTRGVEVIEEFPFLKVVMSCGGGMGGCKWNEYIKPTTLKANTTNDVETIFGDKITINTAFMVKSKLCKCIVAREDATDWRNYHKHECDSYVINNYFSIPINCEYEILGANKPYNEDSIKNNIIANVVYTNGKCTDFKKY